MRFSVMTLEWADTDALQILVESSINILCLPRNPKGVRIIKPFTVYSDEYLTFEHQTSYIKRGIEDGNERHELLTRALTVETSWARFPAGYFPKTSSTNTRGWSRERGKSLKG